MMCLTFIQTRLIDSVDVLIMTKSPYTQELSVKCLAEAVDEVLEVSDGYRDSPMRLTVSDLERLMHVKVSVTASDESNITESLYSVLVGIFKDRRGRIVRACKKALSKVVDDMRKADTSTPTKKHKGGFPGPPKSTGVVYGFQRSVVTLSEKTSIPPALLSADSESAGKPPAVTERLPQLRIQKTYVRMVERGFPDRDEEDMDDGIPLPYTVKIFKCEIPDYKHHFSYYKDSEPGDLEYDFQDHVSYLAYFAHVCNECNTRVPNPRVEFRVASQPDIETSAQSHDVAMISCDRYGNVTEVSGTCHCFDAFVACQV